jgi:dihydrofolate reductase
MGKIVVTEYVTLDGVVESPEWIGPYWDEDTAKFKYEELFGGDVLLMGRRTYEYFAPVWMSATAEDDEPGQEGFADRVNSLPKYIVSTTLQGTDWNNAHVISRDVVDTISHLRTKIKRDILVAGSGTLVRTLMEHNLVDEYRLLVYPIVLGRGRHLFEEGSQATMRLQSATPFSKGVVALVLTPVRAD